MKSEVLKKLIVLLYTFFIFSGLIKWVKIWPLDPTMLFGSLTICLTLVLLVLKRNAKYYKTELRYLAVFVLFSLWFYTSMLYSASTSYKFTKSLNFVLIVISFIVPYFTINSKKDIKFYLFSFSSIGIIISIVIFYLFLSGGNNLYYTYFKLLEYGNPLGVPDYLALGVPVGLATVVYFHFNSKLLKLIGVFTFLSLILLSGRGPIFAVIVSVLIIFLSNFKLTKRAIKTTLISLIILIGSSNYIMKWEGFERLSDRIDIMDKGDESITSRVDQLIVAKELIIKYPLQGIGLGAFGIECFGIDMRAYPHNLIIEILVEQGLIGLILFSFLFVPFVFIIIRNLLRSKDAILFIPAGLFIYELLNALKSSSIIEHRLFFALIGICIVSYKFLEPVKRRELTS